MTTSSNNKSPQLQGWRGQLNQLVNKAGVWPLVLVVGAVLTYVLVGMIWDRMSLLRNGQEVVVNVVPVDPRSLFRGDYVILNYEISQVDRALLVGEIKRGQQVYLTLKKSPTDASYTASAASLDKPDSVGVDEIVVRSKLRRFGSRRNSQADTYEKTMWLTFGAENFFVEEGRGKDIEKQIAEKKIQVVWAVAESGEVAVKALLFDGERLYDQPLL